MKKNIIVIQFFIILSLSSYAQLTRKYINTDSINVRSGNVIYLNDKAALDSLAANTGTRIMIMDTVKWPDGTLQTGYSAAGAESDPVWLADSVDYLLKSQLAGSETDPIWISDSADYLLKSQLAGSETDPIWIGDSSNYATKSYADNYTESDPIWISDSSDYATKSYADNYTETDPIWISDSSDYALKSYVDASHPDSTWEYIKINSGIIFDAKDTLTGIKCINAGCDSAWVYINNSDSIKIGGAVTGGGGGTADPDSTYITISTDTLKPLSGSTVVIEDDIEFQTTTTQVWDSVGHAAALNLDFSDGDYKYVYVTGTETININNLPSGESLLFLEQNATGYAITKGTGWGTLMGEGAISSTANDETVIQFLKVVLPGGGTKIRHFIISD